jgi:hypothetical protein
MQIVPSTFLALAVIAVLMWRGPLRGLWLFLMLAPFGAAAAFNLPAVGGASILVLDLAVVSLFFMILATPDGLARVAGTMRPFQPGFWLFLLAVIALVSALMFPRIFAGETQVFGISRADNVSKIVLVPLRPTAGNLTQLFRIFLDVAVFLALATILRSRPDPAPVMKAMIAATGVHVALGVLDVLTFDVGAQALLDPIRTANYDMLTEASMAGIKRMVGGFPEASSFGYFSLGLFGFWLQYWMDGTRRKLGRWMLILSAFVLLRSTSSASYVALLAFLVAFAMISVFRNARLDVTRRSAGLISVTLVALWLGILAALASYELVEPVTRYLDDVLFNKLSSDSGVERASWNERAWINFTETWGIGAGLGALRASNWFLACLGSIGAAGTAVFLAFLYTFAAAPSATGQADRDALIRACKSGGLAMFLSALLTTPTPDLGVFFFALAGMGIGLARGGQVEMRR